MIDIYILAEELPAIAMPAEGSCKKRLNLASVRLFTSEEDALEADCLYLLDVADANRAEGLGPDATFCLCGPIAPEDVRMTSDCLLVQDGSPVPVVLNRVQRVFDRYDRIEREATETALEGAGVAEVLKAGVAALANPVALFDSTSILMVQAGLGAGGARDAIWDDVLELGCAPTRFVGKDDLARLQACREPYVTRHEGIASLETSVRRDGRMVAYLASTELCAPFSDAQISDMYWLQRLLETLWPVLVGEQDASGSSDMLVQQVISRVSVNERLVTSYLEHRGWRADDPYLLLFFYRTDGAFASQLVEPLRRAMLALFPLSTTVTVAEGMLVVLDDPARYEGKDLGSIEELMAKHGLQCSVSSIVHRFTDLWKAYEQCRAARSVATTADGRFVSFEHTCRRYVMHALDSSTQLDALCCPAVEELAARQHGEEFVRSLHAYLACGRNLSRTAESLYIHRNTLVYRIEKIEEVLGADLSEADEDELFYLYLSCLIVERRTTEG